MKHQASFSSQDKSTKLKVSSAAILFGAVRFKCFYLDILSFQRIQILFFNIAQSSTQCCKYMLF